MTYTATCLSINLFFSLSVLLVTHSPPHFDSAQPFVLLTFIFPPFISITFYFFSCLPLYLIPLLLCCLLHRESKGTNRIAARLGSLSYLDNDEDVFDKPVIAPRTRTFPAKSYTIDAPYYNPEPSEPSLKEDQPRTASPATGRATSPPTSRKVDIVDTPVSSDTTPSITPSSHSSLHSLQSPAAVPLQRSPVSEHRSTANTEEATTIVSTSSFLNKVPEPRPPLSGTHSEVEPPSSGSLYKPPHLSSVEPKPAAAPLQRSAFPEHTSTAKKEETTTIVSSSSSLQKVPEPRRPLSGTQTEVEPPSSGSLYKQQPQLSSMEPKPSGLSRVSASLPRSYQRSDSARLTSVIAPRPFGSQSTRIASLPRASTVSTRYLNSWTQTNRAAGGAEGRVESRRKQCRKRKRDLSCWWGTVLLSTSLLPKSPIWLLHE